MTCPSAINWLKEAILSIYTICFSYCIFFKSDFHLISRFIQDQQILYLWISVGPAVKVKRLWVVIIAMSNFLRFASSVRNVVSLSEQSFMSSEPGISRRFYKYTDWFVFFIDSSSEISLFFGFKQMEPYFELRATFSKLTKYKVQTVAVGETNRMQRTERS